MAEVFPLKESPKNTQPLFSGVCSAEAWREKAPSSASEQYGQPFFKLFKSFDFDFYKVDPLLFSPAEITLNDIVKGKTYKAGYVNAEVLKQSFGM